MSDVLYSFWKTVGYAIQQVRALYWESKDDIKIIHVKIFELFNRINGSFRSPSGGTIIIDIVTFLRVKHTEPAVCFLTESWIFIF